MWNSDNAIFNINGKGLSKLEKAFDIVFEKYLVGSCKYYPEKGLCFFIGTDKDRINFPVAISPKIASKIAFDWLETPEAKQVPCEGWDSNTDHDGHNEPGWRLYTEDWGHVGSDWNAVCIKPCYLWMGK